MPAFLVYFGENSMSKRKSEKPVSGTKEWAKHNENLISGCSNDCRYCYAKCIAIRFKRKSPDNWGTEIINPDALAVGFRKRKGRFMFPTTYDIAPEHLDVCMTFLEKILKPGNEVLVVSKPHLDCIRVICTRFYDYRRQIMFRFTIGSTDNNALQFWDQNAPAFDERLESLSYACWAGYATSVSCEPMLDNNADELIRRLLPYVTDSIWFGKMNRSNPILKMNGHGDQETIQRAMYLRESLSDEYVLDLYGRHKNNPRIKWKDSLKKVVGIEIPVVAGLDI